MPNRFIIVADMMASRERRGRQTLARQINEVLNRLGNDFQDAFQAPPALTRGIDEFSAAFRRPDPIFDFLVRLNLFAAPARFRMVAIWGEVDIEPDTTDSARMDGPAFHQAADRLLYLKETGQMFSVSGEDLDPTVCELASQLGSVHQNLVAGLKQRTLDALRHHYGHSFGSEPPTQTETAEVMRISRQAVSDALQRADLNTLERIESAMRTWLASLP